jgi:hypothetical protein
MWRLREVTGTLERQNDKFESSELQIATIVGRGGMDLQVQFPEPEALRTFLTNASQ